MSAEVVVEIEPPVCTAVFEGAVREKVRAGGRVVLVPGVVLEYILRYGVRLVMLPVDECFGVGQLVEESKEFEVLAQERLVFGYTARDSKVADTGTVAKVAAVVVWRQACRAEVANTIAPVSLS